MQETTTPTALEVAKELVQAQRFLKNAFEIDGNCKFVDFTTVNSMRTGELNSAIFELKDSKRGLFYVTLSH